MLPNILAKTNRFYALHDDIALDTITLTETRQRELDILRSLTGTVLQNEYVVYAQIESDVA